MKLFRTKKTTSKTGMCSWDVLIFISLNQAVTSSTTLTYWKSCAVFPVPGIRTELQQSLQNISFATKCQLWKHTIPKQNWQEMAAMQRKVWHTQFRKRNGRPEETVRKSREEKVWQPWDTSKEGRKAMETMMSAKEYETENREEKIFTLFRIWRRDPQIVEPGKKKP